MTNIYETPWTRGWVDEHPQAPHLFGVKRRVPDFWPIPRSVSDFWYLVGLWVCRPVPLDPPLVAIWIYTGNQLWVCEGYMCFFGGGISSLYFFSGLVLDILLTYPHIYIIELVFSSGWRNRLVCLFRISVLQVLMLGTTRAIHHISLEFALLGLRFVWAWSQSKAFINLDVLLEWIRHVASTERYPYIYI